MIVMPDGSYAAVKSSKGACALIGNAASYFDDKIYQAKNFSDFIENFRKTNCQL
jgi:hypothetical protein